MKRIAILSAAALLLTGCSFSPETEDTQNALTILNYGMYLEPEAISMFEDTYGIKIKYEEYESPESMYTKYHSGAISYDLICTSDYMAEKLIKENETIPVDFSEMPNASYIEEKYFNYASSFDPENSYCLPYFFGTLGILYDSTVVPDELVRSWKVLWNEDYKNSIIMENSVRDTFVPALSLLGYSINTTDEGRLKEALALLQKQKELVYAYYTDETMDEMIIGDAALALTYSGEASAAELYNSRLKFAVPDEGSNMWMDVWLIPKTCKNTELAKEFLNFLCSEEISEMNYDYVYYATPHSGVYRGLDQEEKDNPASFPPDKTLKNCEFFKSLGDDELRLYNDLWKELKAY